MTSRGLGIMAKAPLAGVVKTRLMPPLDGEQAALLYSAFLRDTILLGLSVPECRISVVHPPAADMSGLQSLLPQGVELVQQSGSGLGEALHGAFEHMWSRGAGAAVLIGSDSPTLPATILDDAFSTLECCECD